MEARALSLARFLARSILIFGQSVGRLLMHGLPARRRRRHRASARQTPRRVAVFLCPPCVYVEASIGARACSARGCVLASTSRRCRRIFSWSPRAGHVENVTYVIGIYSARNYRPLYATPPSTRHRARASGRVLGTL